MCNAMQASSKAQKFLIYNIQLLNETRSSLSNSIKDTIV